MIMSGNSQNLAKAIAKAIFYASIQASIGSVEMSSKFSVMNFSKDQQTLQRAADALNSYIVIGVIWTIGTMLSLYSAYSTMGAFIGFIMNFIMMGWIVISYVQAFAVAAEQNGLEKPVLFKDGDMKILALLTLLGIVCIYLLNKYKCY